MQPNPAPVVDTARVDPDGVVRLIGKILRGTPNLPGAACIGRHDLFDDVLRDYAATRAARIAAAGHG